MQIKDNNQVESACTGPYTADGTSPFLVRSMCAEVTFQPILHDVETVIDAGYGPELFVYFRRNAVFTYQRTMR